MNTIREMFEMAAKAAGIAGEYDIYKGQFRRYIEGQSTFLGEVWNPKDDDGDALRLMVDCALKVEVYRENACRKTACVEVFGYETRRLLVLQQARNNDELLAATRLAITRAAAMVGRAMP